MNSEQLESLVGKRITIIKANDEGGFDLGLEDGSTYIFMADQLDSQILMEKLNRFQRNDEMERSKQLNRRKDISTREE